MRSGGLFYFFAEDFRLAFDFVVDFVFDVVADFAAGFEADLRALLVLVLGAFAAVDEFVLAPVEDAAEVLRRCPLDAVRNTTGSATRRRRPGSTLMPVTLFQRRNWLRETPKRSAMVTSVSPLRTV
jgi:hypothetical protein